MDEIVSDDEISNFIKKIGIVDKYVLRFAKYDIPYIWKDIKF